MAHRGYRVSPMTSELTPFELYTWAEQVHIDRIFLKLGICFMLFGNVILVLFGYAMDIWLLRSCYIEQRSFGYTLAVTVVPTVLINTLSLS